MALVFGFHNLKVLSTSVPPPSNLTMIVSGVQSFQIAWNHPSGYDPGKFSTSKPSNSTLDEYRFWIGSSETDFILLSTRQSVLPTSFTINNQAFDIQVGGTYIIRVVSRSCCSSLTFFSQACTGLTCQSSSTSFSLSSGAYPLNGYATASAVAFGYPSAPSTVNISVVSVSSSLSYPSKGALSVQWSLPTNTGSAAQVITEILAYQVTRASNSTFIDGVTIFFGLPTPSGGVYSTEDIGLTPGAMYHYRINARNLACGVYTRALRARNQPCSSFFPRANKSNIVRTQTTR
jgi:hypothetical protein